MSEAGEKLAKNGWEQGSVLKPADVSGFSFIPTLALGNDDIVIVISQSCDVVQRVLTVEPFVEVLRASKVTEANGNLTFGKNPRRLQFEIAGCLFEASCHDRARLTREELLPCMPSLLHKLDHRTIDVIAGWIAKRYTRPALPDEFNIRIDDRRSKLSDVLKKHGGPIDQILIYFTPEGEAEPAISYAVAIQMVMIDEDYENETKRAKARGVLVPFEKHMKECRGIDVQDCILVPESKITLDDLRFLTAWDFDYLTHRSNLIENPS